MTVVHQKLKNFCKKIQSYKSLRFSNFFSASDLMKAMVEAKKTSFKVVLSLLFTEITKIFLIISIGAWESRYDSENILERMAAIEGKLEKLQEQYVQKEQRIYSLEAINIELKLQLNLKEAKEYTEVLTRSLASKGELEGLQVRLDT